PQRPHHIVQQVENHRQNHQQDDGEELCAERDVEDRPAVDEIFAQDLDRLQRRAGAKNYRYQNGGLQRVEHQGVDMELRDVAENLGAKRLPVRERVGENADQRRKPENHVVEMDEWDVGEEIGLERAVEIEENEEDDDRDDPDPELLLFGSIVRHIRRLVVC